MIKLIKHDLKSILTTILGFYLALIVVALITPVLLNYTDVTLLIVLTFLISFGILVAVAVLTYVGIFNLLNKKLYSAIGTLTLTLPFSTRKLLLSKLFTSLIIFLITTIVVMLSVSLSGLINLWLNPIRSDQFQLLLSYVRITGFDTFIRQVILVMIPSVLITIVFSLTLLLFAISLVHTSYINKHKVLIGVIAFVTIALLVNGIDQQFFNNQIMQTPHVSEGMFPFMPFSIDFSSIIIPYHLIIARIIYYFVVSVALFELTVHLVEHKLELT